MPDRLRLVRSPADRAACRIIGCGFSAQGALGYCGPCEAVYHAARELRARLLERRGAQLRAHHRLVLDELSAPVRDRLVAHMAANTAHRGQPAWLFEQVGLEDFLGELHELGLTG